jgi:hypothetical protein
MKKLRTKRNQGNFQRKGRKEKKEGRKEGNNDRGNEENSIVLE